MATNNKRSGLTQPQYRQENISSSPKKNDGPNCDDTNSDRNKHETAFGFEDDKVGRGGDKHAPKHASNDACADDRGHEGSKHEEGSRGGKHESRHGSDKTCGDDRGHEGSKHEAAPRGGKHESKHGSDHACGDDRGHEGSKHEEGSRGGKHESKHGSDYTCGDDRGYEGSKHEDLSCGEHKSRDERDDRHKTDHACTNDRHDHKCEAPRPDFSVTKTVVEVDGCKDRLIVDEANDTVTYEIKVTNTGNVAFDKVQVLDKLEGGCEVELCEYVGDHNHNGKLDPCESWTYKLVVKVDQQAIDREACGDHKIDNSAFVKVETCNGWTATKCAEASVPVCIEPGLQVTKSVVGVWNPDGSQSECQAVDQAGDKIKYVIEVKNTGNVDLHNVSVVDKFEGSCDAVGGPDCGDDNHNGVLDVGETWKYTVTKTVDQALIDREACGDKTIDNIAKATATVCADGCQPVSDESCDVKVPLKVLPGIDVTKSVVGVWNPDGSQSACQAVDQAGDKIKYVIEVKNTGNVDLHNVSVVDKFEGSCDAVGGPDCGDDNHNGVLDVGETWKYTVTKTVDQALIDREACGDKTIDNVAKASATVCADGCQPVSDESCDVKVPLKVLPGIDVTKSVVGVWNPDGSQSECQAVDQAGDKIKYVIEVKNTGNVDLHNVSVVDKFEGSCDAVGGPDCGDDNHNGVLDVGETWKYTVTKTVDQALIDREACGDKTIDNVAKASATVCADGCQPVSDESCDVKVPLKVLPGIDVTKSVVGVWNPDGSQSECQAVDQAGDKIKYVIEVKNTGNVDLHNVNVVDKFEGSCDAVGAPDRGDDNHNGVLDVGETWKYTVTKTVDQALIDREACGDKTIDNIAKATATVCADGCQPVSDESCDVKVPLKVLPGIDVTKSVVGVWNPDGSQSECQAVDQAGDKIKYVIEVKNTGNVDLHNVNVVDKFEGSCDAVGGPDCGDDNHNGVLDVGETWKYTVTKTVDQALIDREACGDKTIDNVAKASATVCADGCQPVSDESCDVKVPLKVLPGIDVTKSVVGVWNPDGSQSECQAVDQAGDKIKYVIEVKNTGNVDLHNVSVVDKFEGSCDAVGGPDCGDDNHNGVLDVGETWKYTVTKTVDQALIDREACGDKTIDNVAKASATVCADGCQPVSDESCDVKVPLKVLPGIDVTKSVVGVWNPDGSQSACQAVDQAGDQIKYVIEVKNTGNVTLHDVKVTDLFNGGAGEQLTKVSGDNGNCLLDVGETWSYEVTKCVTQQMIDKEACGDRLLTNVATASAATCDDGCGKVTDTSDTVLTPVKINPGVSVRKDMVSITNPDGTKGGAIVDQVGDKLLYKISVTNTGNVTLDNVVVKDQFESDAAKTLTGFMSSGNSDLKLDVGETWTFTFEHTVTADDLAKAQASTTVTKWIGTLYCTSKVVTGDCDLDNIAYVDATYGDCGKQMQTQYSNLVSTATTCPSCCSHTDYGGSTAEILAQNLIHAAA